MTRVMWCIWTIALVILSTTASAAADASPVLTKLTKKYAPFLGEKGAREYLQELPFNIGDSESTTATLLVKGQRYQIELIALADTDDCESCRGRIDTFVFRNGKPFFLEKSVWDGGSHGRPYMGDKVKVFPLTKESEGLLVTGMMWQPEGCSLFKVDLYGIDIMTQKMKLIFEAGEGDCDQKEGVRVSALQFDSKGLDAEGRGTFVLTLVKERGSRKLRSSRMLRFDSTRWSLVDSK